MSARFDWYEASLDGYQMRPGPFGSSFESKCAWFLSTELLLGCFEEDEFTEECDRREWRIEDFNRKEERGFNHYSSSLACYTPENTLLFRLLWSSDSSLHLISSGGRSAVVSRVLRRLVPLHYVTRVDSAIDFVGEDRFSELVERAEYVREKTFVYGKKISTTMIQQDRETAGKTFYLGSMSSETLMRIYDKAVEQRAKLPKHLRADVPPVWSRCEVVARPKDKERRLFLSRCDASDVWQSSDSVAEFYKLLNESEFLQDMPDRPKKDLDLNKAYWTMLYQYRRTFLWLLSRTKGDRNAASLILWGDLDAADLLHDPDSIRTKRGL